MDRIVIKRNGEYQTFHPYKIEDALQKAFQGQHKKIDSILINTIFLKLAEKEIWSVEEIQDIIEKELYNRNHFQTMRAFMLHRHTRKLQREHIQGLNEDTTYIDCSQTIEEYIYQKDWRINANANTSYSSAGLINNVAGKIIANYWLDKVYSKEEAYAHRNGDLHIHDLDCLTGYCAGWSLRMLLNDGFNGVRGRVESRAPSPVSYTHLTLPTSDLV